jgi:hypothetical protein
VAGVVGLDHGRLHEPALGVVGAAADQDLDAGVGPDPLQDLAESTEGASVDHRAQEVPEIGDVAHGEALDLGQELLAEP